MIKALLPRRQTQSDWWDLWSSAWGGGGWSGRGLAGRGWLDSAGGTI